MNIEGPRNKQNASGFERIGNWTKKIPRACYTKKKCQAKGKYDVTSLSILVAALNLLVLPPSRQSKRPTSTWTQVIIF